MLGMYIMDIIITVGDLLRFWHAFCPLGVHFSPWESVGGNLVVCMLGFHLVDMVILMGILLRFVHALCALNVHFRAYGCD